MGREKAAAEASTASVAVGSDGTSQAALQGGCGREAAERAPWRHRVSLSYQTCISGLATGAGQEGPEAFRSTKGRGGRQRNEKGRRLEE